MKQIILVPKKLLRSKKGGIPAINEIVNTFLAVVPPPILAVIFVLLITTISSFVLPIFFNLFGYACVQKGNELELYQTPLSNFLSKAVVDIESNIDGGFFLGTDEFQLPADPFPISNDKRFLRVPDQCLIHSDNNGTDLFGYSRACVECPYNFNLFTPFTPSNEVVCVGDSTKTLSVHGFLREFCGQCAPPEPYYYNHSNCQFYLNSSERTCVFTISNNTLVVDINSDFFHNTYLQKIIELGGVKKEQQDDQFANIQCSDVGKPNLFFFSIEIFNTQMWILLFVASGLVTFAYMWYGQVFK